MISKNLPFHFADFVFEAACSFRGLDLTSNSLSAQGLHKDLHCDGGRNREDLTRQNFREFSRVTSCRFTLRSVPVLLFLRISSISWTQNCDRTKEKVEVIVILVITTVLLGVYGLPLPPGA